MDLPFLGQIASQGLLGVLLALSLFANWWFIKKLQDTNEKRVADAKDISNNLLTPIQQIKTNGEVLISLFQNFLEGSKKV